MGRWFESNTAHQIKLVQPEMNQLSSILSKIIQLHNGGNFLKKVTEFETIDEEILEEYAPNVVEGVKKLTNWAKNL